ncbi:tetratricopeptide repeat protein [Polaribacter litorisediminis]|uniref:tetratricopeptide repeat protein n=1 Tax=Polaribacter litorisediminis TaxID=1908341 RepID=UPI001CBABA84|nr:tetratricopeptide repeat protein [Polaribacter litorisediminis]UAM98807.1 tetratricopeptide repeat protein [Polaribacter litorisediminis]
MKKLVITFLCTLLFSTTISAQSESSKAYSKSYELEAAKDYKQAIVEMEKIYAESSYDMNLRLGWLHYMAGDFFKSQKYYDKAIEIAKNSVEARLGLIYPLSAMQNWNNVLQTYLDIVSIDAHNSTANYQIAVIYFIRQDYQKALKFANNVHTLYPFDYNSNVLIGKIKIKLGDISGAKRHLNRALNYSPTSQEVLYLLSTL